MSVQGPVALYSGRYSMSLAVCVPSLSLQLKPDCALALQRVFKVGP